MSADTWWAQGDRGASSAGIPRLNVSLLMVSLECNEAEQVTRPPMRGIGPYLDFVTMPIR